MTLPPVGFMKKSAKKPDPTARSEAIKRRMSRLSSTSTESDAGTEYYNTRKESVK